MQSPKLIGKRDFIQHTSKYMKWVEEHGDELIITHQGIPDLALKKIKLGTFKDLRGSVELKVHADINEHVLLGYDKW